MAKISIAEYRDKLNALPLPKRLLLLGATIVFLGAAFYFLAYEQQLDSVRRLTVKRADEEKRLTSLKQAAAKVQVLEKDLAQAEEELSMLLTLLPDQKEIPGLLENVSRLGSKVGLENILFQPQPEVPQEYYAVIPLRLDLLGTFNDLGVFLDSVSKLNRILKVDTVTVVRPKDKAKGSMLQVACTLVTYRFLEKPVEKAKPGKKK